MKSNARIFDEDPDVSIYIKKATDIFKRIIILFDDDEFTDSLGVSATVRRVSRSNFPLQVKGLPEDKTSPQMYTLCIDICNVLIEYKFLRMQDT